MEGLLFVAIIGGWVVCFALLLPFTGVKGFIRNLVIGVFGFLALILVNFGIAGLVMFSGMLQVRSAGGGGIGAVSVGISEMLFETGAVVLVAMLVLRIVRRVRGQRSAGSR